MARRKLATRAEVIEALGLDSPRRLDKMIERGAPGPAPGKKGTRRYDLDALRTWMEERRARMQPVLDLNAERAKLARVQRQLARLKVHAMRKTLVPEKDVVSGWRAVLGATRAQLLAVPRQAVLSGLPREHEPLVKRLITDALRELSEVQSIEQLSKGRTPEDDE